MQDDSYSSELRELSFGLVGGVVEACVVHTQRGDRTRIISGRKATKAERKLFNDHLRKAYR